MGWGEGGGSTTNDVANCYTGPEGSGSHRWGAAVSLWRDGGQGAVLCSVCANPPPPPLGAPALRPLSLWAPRGRGPLKRTLGWGTAFFVLVISRRHGPPFIPSHRVDMKPKAVSWPRPVHVSLLWLTRVVPFVFRGVPCPQPCVYCIPISCWICRRQTIPHSSITASHLSSGNLPDATAVAGPLDFGSRRAPTLGSHKWLQKLFWKLLQRLAVVITDGGAGGGGQGVDWGQSRPIAGSQQPHSGGVLSVCEHGWQQCEQSQTL